MLNEYMEDVRIILTTRGRINRQFTLNNLNEDILNNITIVCYPGEYEEHYKNWRGKVKEIIEHPSELIHLGQIRKWCLENFSENYIILLDDNMKFSIRLKSQKQDLKSIITIISENNFDEDTIDLCLICMFVDIINYLKLNEYGIVGLSLRSLNPNQKGDISENIRVYGFWGVNKLLYNELIDKDSWSEFYNKNDFALQLAFLSNGIKNVCLNLYAFDKSGGANSKGGCSILRTNELSNKEAYQLKSLYPEFVEVRQKSTKNWGGDFGNMSLDNYIYWKKAYEYGIKNNLK